MRTKKQLKNKINDLEQWLKENPSTHENRPLVETDIRKAKQMLDELKSHRTIERDTFDIREHNFS